MPIRRGEIEFRVVSDRILIYKTACFCANLNNSHSSSFNFSFNANVGLSLDEKADLEVRLAAVVDAGRSLMRL